MSFYKDTNNKIKCFMILERHDETQGNLILHFFLFNYGIFLKIWNKI